MSPFVKRRNGAFQDENRRLGQFSTLYIHSGADFVTFSNFYSVDFGGWPARSRTAISDDEIDGERMNNRRVVLLFLGTIEYFFRHFEAEDFLTGGNLFLGYFFSK